MKLGIFWDPLNPLVPVRPVVKALSAICDVVEFTFESCTHRINPNNSFEISSQLDRERIDTVFWIEGGPLPADIHRCGRTSACWLINTHLEPTLWEDFNELFHWTFTTDRSISTRSRSRWLPLSLTGSVHPGSNGFHFFGEPPLAPTPSETAFELISIAAELPVPPVPIALCFGQKGIPHSRLFDHLAARSISIVDSSADIRDIGNPGEHLLVAPEPKELRRFLREIVEDTSKSQAIASRGSEIVQHLHTPEIRANKILNSIQGISRVLGGARFHPLISVLTFCFRYLKRFRVYLESLARQTLPAGSLEIVVTDPQSPDGLSGYLEEFAACNPHLRVVHVPVDSRYSRNRGFCINRAFEESSGDIILATDGDIVFPPRLVEELASICTSKPQHVFGVRRTFLNPQLTEAIITMNRDPFSDFENLKNLSGDGEVDGKLGVLGYCQVLSRAAFAAAGYPESFDKVNQSDIVFVERLAQHAGVTPFFLADRTVLHLWHPRDWNGTQQDL